MCEKKTNQSEQNAKAGKPPAVSRDCADGFLPIKGTITSLVMIASSLCNYTILSAAAKMSVILMNVVITVIGVVLALFVNLRYGKLLARTEK